jgi:hypothetical protein
MSSHHDHDNHSQLNQNQVAFRTPLIMGLVTILIILLAVSTCDNKHHGKCECKEDCSEECMKKCESGDHSGHGCRSCSRNRACCRKHTTLAPAEEHAAVADTTAKAAHSYNVAAPAKVEAPRSPLIFKIKYISKSPATIVGLLCF